MMKQEDLINLGKNKGKPVFVCRPVFSKKFKIFYKYSTIILTKLKVINVNKI